VLLGIAAVAVGLIVLVAILVAGRGATAVAGTPDEALSSTEAIGLLSAAVALVLIVVGILTPVLDQPRGKTYLEREREDRRAGRATAFAMTTLLAGVALLALTLIVASSQPAAEQSTVSSPPSSAEAGTAP
jgi:hypothetical protein